MIVNTPKPPYYAVIFTSILSDSDNDYLETAEYIHELAKQQDGYLGMESARDSLGISVSYWRDLESIRNWSMNSEHIKAKTKGKSTFYDAYKTRISKVEREY